MTRNRKKKHSIREYAAASGLTYSQARNVLAVARPGLSELGFSDGARAAIRRSIAEPTGLVVIAGLTFTGKSTLLAAAAVERPDALVIDDIPDGDTLSRAIAEAAGGRKVIVTLYARGPVDARHEIAQLTAPNGEEALAAISSLICVHLVRTTAETLAPVASVEGIGEGATLLDDLVTLADAGVIDRTTPLTERFPRPQRPLDLRARG